MKGWCHAGADGQDAEDQPTDPCGKRWHGHGSGRNPGCLMAMKNRRSFRSFPMLTVSDNVSGLTSSIEVKFQLI